MHLVCAVGHCPSSHTTPLCLWFHCQSPKKFLQAQQYQYGVLRCRTGPLEELPWSWSRWVHMVDVVVSFVFVCGVVRLKTGCLFCFLFGVCWGEINHSLGEGLFLFIDRDHGALNRRVADLGCTIISCLMGVHHSVGQFTKNTSG